MLTAIVTRAPEKDLTSQFLLGEFDGDVAVLIEPIGIEQVLLRRGGRIVQLRCLGESIIVEPAAIGAVVDEFPEIENKAQVIRRLAALYRGDDDRDDGSWSPGAMRLRNALIALDGRIAGRSYREIAIVLYGEARVAEEWSDIGRILKNRTIRAAKRGRALMQGDYVKLLS